MGARWVLVAAGVSGAIAVGLGAYGAHGLEAALAGADELAKRLGWWQTAVSYHLPHSVALAVVGALRAGRARAAAAVAFCVGILLFSGSLYAMTLGAPRWLGAVTPVGGLSLIAGWIGLAVAGAREGGNGG